MTEEEVWLHAPEILLSPASHSGVSLRRLNRQISHADQVVGGCSKGEVPSHLEDSAMPKLPQQRDRLQPSEALFNALPLFLTDGISGVVRRASNCCSSFPRMLSSYQVVLWKQESFLVLGEFYLKDLCGCCGAVRFRFTEQRKSSSASSSRLSAGSCSSRPSLQSSTQVQAASLPCRSAEKGTHAIGRVQAPRSF